MRNVSGGTLGVVIGTTVGIVMSVITVSLIHWQMQTRMEKNYLDDPFYFTYAPLTAILAAHGLTCGIITGRFRWKTIRGGILGFVVLLGFYFLTIAGLTLLTAFFNDPPRVCQIPGEYKGFFECTLTTFIIFWFWFWLIPAVLVIPSIIDGAIIGFLTSRLSKLRVETT